MTGTEKKSEEPANEARYKLIAMHLNQLVLLLVIENGLILDVQ
jgi:hypothetical protein